MDYQKETHTSRRLRLISTILVGISCVIIFLTSCDTEYKSQQIYLEVCDLTRPYFYYQVTVHNDTIAFFSPSKGYTEKILSNSERTDIENAVRMLDINRTIIHDSIGNIAEFNCEDYDYEYKHYSVKLQVNRKNVLYVTDMHLKSIPTQYINCIEQILNKSDHLCRGISKQQYKDQIFDDYYFVIDRDSTMTSIRNVTNPAKGIELPKIEMSFQTFVNNDPFLTNSMSGLKIIINGDSVITQANLLNNSANTDYYYKLFAPYRGCWNILKKNNKFTHKLNASQVSELINLSKIVTMQQPYTCIFPGNNTFSCTLRINEQLIFYVHDCHFDNAPLEMIKMYMCILKSSGLATYFAKIMSNKSN
jgi:hypothetical protein